MTDTPKPLTADEIADIKADTRDPYRLFPPIIVQRLIATIEQQREQIEKLREALTEISLGRGPFNLDPMKHTENTIEAMKELAQEALAATEPVNDKR